MAQVSTPRFYVSVLQWLKSLGKLDSANYSWFGGSGLSVVDINPSTQTEIVLVTTASHSIWFKSKAGAFNTIMPEKNTFFMVLGHSLTDVYFIFKSSSMHGLSVTELVNYNPYSYSHYNGFSIGIGNDLGVGIEMSFFLQSDIFESLSQTKIGSLLYGNYYDIQAPNLQLTMSREYGEIKEISTYNGGSISNTMANKPPAWGDLGAWELGGSDPKLSRSGRRSWDLKFSYIDDGDLWGSNQSLSRYIGDTSGLDQADEIISGTSRYNILTDDNFFSQVWHKTQGGTLPFIFQPDAPVLNETTGEYEGGNNNPDQFAICKFKNNSLKATQSAFNVYDISLSIEEVW